MTLPSYKDLSSFSSLADIREELGIQQKALTALKTSSSSKTFLQRSFTGSLVWAFKQPHLKKQLKRRIAHLKFKESLLLKAS
jgi:hypothetical protein